MPSVMAIVSKAIFERDAAGLAVGAVWPTDRYVSQNKGLAPLHDGGDLYLVTVRPGELLWLVGVLRKPSTAVDGWRAKPNARPIQSIDALKPKLQFSTGAGITAKAGALGMSLQTPRVLTDADVALLEAAVTGARAETTPKEHQPAEAQHRDALPAPKPGATQRARAAAPKKQRSRDAQTAPTRGASTQAAAPKEHGPGALPELDQVLAALKEARVGLALAYALAAWRKLRAPGLASLLDALAKEANQSLAPLEGQRAALQEAWLDLASKRRAVDVERLLARLGDGNMAQLRTRYEALRGFAPDPRLVGRALAVVAEYHSYEIGPCINLALDLASDSADPHARATLERYAVAHLTPRSGDSTSWKEFLEKNRRKVEKVRAQLPEKVEVPAAVKQQLDACASALRPLSKRTMRPAEVELLAEVGAASDPTAELLARVLEKPDDLSARLIYGDALQDRGDARGELIALQCSEPTPAREKQSRALIKEHGRAWIAPLDLCVRPDSVRFERGFLSACRVEFNTPTQRAELSGHPLWRTVKEIDCDDQDFLLGEQLVSLTRATLEPATLARLAARAHPVPLEAVIGTLEMNYGVRMRRGITAGPPSAWGRALAVGALTRLTSLELSGWSHEEAERVALTPSGLGWLLESKLGRQLKELRLDYGRAVPPLREWVEFLSGQRPGLTLRCTFTNGNTASGSTQIVVVIEAARVGDRVEVEASFNNEMVDLRYLSMPEQVEALLEGLPHPKAPRVVTRYTGTKKRTQRGFPAIARLLATAFPHVEELD